MGGIRVGILGATGLVGREMLRLLEERAFPVADLRLLATRRSAGTLLDFRGEHLRVQEVGPGNLHGLDLLLVSAGHSAARALVPEARRRGAVVVDNSSAFRRDPQVPLVVPEVNGGLLEAGPSLVANPNCSTIIMVLALAPLHAAWGLESVVAVTFQAASGAGSAGETELLGGLQRWARGEEAPAEVFQEPLPFNVLPMIGAPAGGGGSAEEEKMLLETRRILDAPQLRVVATCARVPVRRCHTVAVTCTLAGLPSLHDVKAVLTRAAGLEVLEVPTPRKAEGRDAVLVGRLRQAPWNPAQVSLVCVGDQIRKGAALNAVQIAERLMQAGRRAPR